MEFFPGATAATALLAGVLAAFNPCGFALLPAYITVLVTGSAEEGVSRQQAIRRAISFGVAMTLGFLAVFLVFGLIFATANAGFQGNILPYVPYVTVVLGVLLVVLGIHMLRGGQLNIPGLKIKGAAPTRAFGSQIVYGIAFAFASMSCTIGVYLPIVTASLNAQNPVSAALPSVVYGIGMGTSVLAVSLIAAIAGSSGVAALRRRTPVFMRAAGALMLVVGAYVIAYGLAEILPQFGVHALDSVLLTTGDWQGAVNRWIASWGNATLVVVAVLTLGASVWLWLWSRGDEKGAAPK